MSTDDIKVVTAVVASVISVGAYVPYLRDLFQQKIKPHLYTWFTFFLVTITVAFLQVIGGAGIGALPTILAAIINAVILFYCFKYGTKDIVLLDKICLVISIFGVLIFAFTQDQPIFSLIVVTIAEITSFLPTIRKTKNDPYSESQAYYILVMVKIILILFSLETYNLVTISYPATWLVVIVAYVGLTDVWRKQAKSKKQLKGVK